VSEKTLGEVKRSGCVWESNRWNGRRREPAVSVDEGQDQVNQQAREQKEDPDDKKCMNDFSRARKSASDTDAW
jgi:hypothetical protein